MDRIKAVMIEDDGELAEILKEYLGTVGVDVENYEDPFTGLSAIKAKKFDILILDLTLPGLDGLEVCAKVASSMSIPIIISTARGDINDKLTGLKLGADDYIPKPYDPKELHARILSILRRYNKKTVHREEKRLRVDHESRSVILDDTEIQLTRAEFDIVDYLAKKENCVVSREELLNNIESISYDSSYKSIDVIIGRIRQKMESDPKNPTVIITVRGIGYKLINH